MIKSNSNLKKQILLKFSEFVEKEKGLYKKINLVIPDKLKARKMSYIFVGLYTAICIFLYVYILVFEKNPVWYVKFINTVLATILPYVIIQSFINILYSRLIKKIPDCIKLFQYNFNRELKINNAIKETGDELTGPLKVPFQELYYNLSKGFSEAFTRFNKTFNDKDINEFSSLLETYMNFGGNMKELNIKLADLVNKIQEKNLYKNKTFEKLILYKFAAVFMIIGTVLCEKYMVIITPDVTSTVDITLNTKFMFVILFYVIYFFFIDIIKDL